MKQLTPYRQRVLKYTVLFGYIAFVTLLVNQILNGIPHFMPDPVNYEPGLPISISILMLFWPTVVTIAGFVCGILSRRSLPGVQRRYNGTLLGLLAVWLYMAINNTAIAQDLQTTASEQSALLPMVFVVAVVALLAMMFSYQSKWPSILRFPPFLVIAGVSLLGTVGIFNNFFSWDVGIFAVLTLTIMGVISHFVLHRQKGYHLLDAGVVTVLFFTVQLVSAGLFLAFQVDDNGWMSLSCAFIVWLSYLFLLARQSPRIAVKKAKTRKIRV